MARTQGERRRGQATGLIVSILREGPRTFGQLLDFTELSRRALHSNLKRLVEDGVVEQRAKRSPYSLRADLLTPQDLKNLSDISEIRRIIHLLDGEGEHISKIRRRKTRENVLALFLVQNLCLMATYVSNLLLDVSDFADIQRSDVLLEKAARSMLDPWVGLLNVACFRNRDVLKPATRISVEPFRLLLLDSLGRYSELLRG